MAERPRRDQETLRLVEQHKRRQAQRRHLLLAAKVLGGLVVLALVTTAVLLVFRSPASRADGETDLHTALSAAPTDQGPSDSRAASSLSSAVTNSVESSAATSSTASAFVPAPETTGSSLRPPPSSSGSPSDSPSSTTASTAVSTTGTPKSTSTTAIGQKKAASPTGKVVVIDPGHQARANNNLEPVGPGSSTMKAKVSSGTSGVATGTPESKLVLTISLKLRDSLEARGIRVVMTRTTQDVDISNVERAQIANAAQADLFVRIHADGSDDSSLRGIHVLYPASIKGWTDDIAEQSKKAALLAQQALVAATGAVDRGVDARSDLTGFNWSDVPVILPEIGFMTNPEEDRLLATPEYQDKIVQGLTQAILTFLGLG